MLPRFMNCQHTAIFGTPRVPPSSSTRAVSSCLVLIGLNPSEPNEKPGNRNPDYDGRNCLWKHIKPLYSPFQLPRSHLAPVVFRRSAPWNLSSSYKSSFASFLVPSIKVWASVCQGGSIGWKLSTKPMVTLSMASGKTGHSDGDSKVQ